MGIVEITRNFVIKESEKFRRTSIDHYDFWNEHIKLVVRNALMLAEKYKADKEIVELGALLHDIALIENGYEAKPTHNVIGEQLAREFLTKQTYDKEKKEKVLGCVLHHRSSKNAENIEELCVCDADILAHFDNIPRCFETAQLLHKNELEKEGVNYFIKWFNKDFDDLSKRTKRTYRKRFKNIMDILFHYDIDTKSIKE